MTSITSAETAAGEERGNWGAVFAMTLCVAMLIASEFMPVSQLTAIAADLGATEGQTGQAVSISGLFAVVASLFSCSIAWDRRHVLLMMTVLMLASLALMAVAPNFVVLMVARAMLGTAIGGFWSLAASVVMRLVPSEDVPKALAIMFTGNAVAAAFAAPLGSYFGATVGWRGVFWAMALIVAANLMWQIAVLPSLPARGLHGVGAVLNLMRRRFVALAMIAVTLTFGGAFAMFTYIRPFLEGYTGAEIQTISLLLLGLGIGGFAGSWSIGRLVGNHLVPLLRLLPFGMAMVTLGMLATGHLLIAVAVLMACWGAINTAMPVSWTTWLTRMLPEDAETGGGLLIAAIQLSIMLGSAFGGVLLDSFGIEATFVGSAMLLAASGLLVGSGHRILP